MIQIMGPLPSLWLEGPGNSNPVSARDCRIRYPAAAIGRATIAGSPCRPRPTRWPPGSCALIGLGDDPRVATVADRMEHRELVEERMAAWVADRTLAEVLEQFEAADAAATAGLRHGRAHRRPSRPRPSDLRDRRRVPDARSDRPTVGHAGQGSVARASSRRRQRRDSRSYRRGRPLVSPVPLHSEAAATSMRS